MKKIFENWRRFTEEEEEVIELPDMGTISADDPPEKVKVDSAERSGEKTGIKSGNLGYVMGTIDGQVLTMHNEDKLFYGASTPKPILALANLIKCSIQPESGRCLTGDELRALLNYTLPKGAKRRDYWHGGNSNTVNKALASARRGQKGVGDKILSVSQELANFASNEEVDKFLTDIGLPDLKVRYGSSNNQQTPMGYYNFMRLLLDSDLQNTALDKASAVASASHEILNYMQRKHGVLKSDREHSGRFLAHMKYLNDKGINVKSIYGKGGYYSQANNSAMVLDDEYILVVYTGSWAAKKRAKKKRVTDLSEIIYQIVKGSGAY
tara:strand:- start:3749 stop:4720 length:972 start_codon:yes stop_codon:yes gene_type:complete